MQVSVCVGLMVLSVFVLILFRAGGLHYRSSVPPCSGQTQGIGFWSSEMCCNAAVGPYFLFG